MATASRPTGDQQAAAVRSVAVPAAARALSTLEHVDYSDCFLAEPVLSPDRSGEDWARELLERASAETRAALRRGWWLLGVRLGRADDRERVLGWEVRRRSDRHVLLAARSLIGVDAEVLCLTEGDRLLVATFLRLHNPVARLVWLTVGPQHRRIVPHLMRQAVRRVQACDRMPARSG